MQTHSLIIKDGTFLETSDNSVQILSPTLAYVGDWECTINSDSLVCTHREPYSEIGQAILRYTIRNNGFSRLTLKLPGSNQIVRRKKWLTKPGNFSFNGVLTLSGGEISHRFVKFKVSNK